MESTICGAYTGKSCCQNKATVNKKTCWAHVGFYDSRKWFPMVIEKSWGRVETTPILEEHIVFAFTEKRVVPSKEDIASYIPLAKNKYEVTVINARFIELIFIYNPQIRRGWNAALWKQALSVLLQRMYMLNRRIPEELYKCMENLVQDYNDLVQMFEQIQATHNATYLKKNGTIRKIIRRILKRNPYFVFDELVELIACGLDAAKVFDETKEEILQERKEFFAKIHEPLIAASWHPRRFVEWCLDEEERAEWMTA